MSERVNRELGIVSDRRLLAPGSAGCITIGAADAAGGAALGAVFSTERIRQSGKGFDNHQAVKNSMVKELIRAARPETRLITVMEWEQRREAHFERSAGQKTDGQIWQALAALFGVLHQPCDTQLTSRAHIFSYRPSTSTQIVYSFGL